MSRNIWKKFSGNKINDCQNFCSKSDELELERHINKLQNVEDACKKIIKNTKKFSGSLSYLAENEENMMSNLAMSELCQQDERLRELVESWTTATVSFNQITPDLESVCQKAIIEPIKKYQTIFSTIHSSVRKRDTLLQECLKCQAKVEKLNEKEKTAQNLVKIEQAKKALQLIKEDFQQQNQLLLQELPVIYDTRIEYFLPSLEALIRAQVSHYGEKVQAIDGISLTDKSDFSSTNSMEKKLLDLKNLSIVNDD